MNAVTFGQEATRLERPLYRIAWSMLGNNDDCADAVQETLAKAWQNRDTLRNIKAFRPWLTRIMVNVCRDMQRTRHRQTWVPLEEDMAVQPAPDEHSLELDEAMRVLSPDMRAVVVLHYLEGYKVREIAQMLDIPSGTVKTRLMHARRKLQSSFGTPERQGGLNHEEA